MGVLDFIARVDEFNNSRVKNKDNIKRELNYKIFTNLITNMDKVNKRDKEANQIEFEGKEEREEEIKGDESEEENMPKADHSNSQLNSVFQIKRPSERDEKSRTDTDNLAGKLAELKASLAKLKGDNKKMNEKNHKLSKVLSRKKRLTQMTRNTMMTEMNSLDRFNNSRRKEKLSGMELITNKLDSEIHSYVGWTESFRKTSAPLFDDLFQLLKSLIIAHFDRELKVTAGGSYANNLYMPWSNLNINVSVAHEKGKNPHFLKNDVRCFAKALQKRKEVLKVNFEETAALCILKINFGSEFNHKQAEVIFKHQSNSPYPANEAVMRDYLVQYPVAKPLYLLFRSLIRQNRLDDPSSYGLRTIVVFLLVIAYLQHLDVMEKDSSEFEETRTLATRQSNPEKAQADNKRLGRLFINMLFYYSYTFDFFKQVIRPYKTIGKFWMPIAKKDKTHKSSSLIVLSPFNSDIILTKSFRRTQELRQILKLSYISLFQSCLCSSRKVISVNPTTLPPVSQETKPNDSDEPACEYPVDHFGPTTVHFNKAKKKLTKKLSLKSKSDKLANKLSNKRNSLVYKNPFKLKYSKQNSLPAGFDLLKQNTIDPNLLTNEPKHVIMKFFNYNFDFNNRI